ncbi:MAG: ribosome maturation factor RimM [Candidatus Kapaibacteriota bacterium]
MDHIFLGTIISLKGLDGTLKVDQDEPLCIKPGAKVKIGYSLKFSQEFTVVEHKLTSSKYNYLRLLEANNIEKANKLIEKGIFVRDCDVLQDSPKYKLNSTTNYNVVDARTGKVLGKAIDIIPNPGNDLLVISSKNEEFFIPFVDVFVKKIEHSSKTIYIEQIDGLIT